MSGLGHHAEMRRPAAGFGQLDKGTVDAIQAERTVLLAVTGLAPQIVTETLYALMHEGLNGLPHEVHIVTTADGAERARLALLSDSPGWFARLLQDYALPPVRFPAEHIHVLHDRAGQPLADIRTAEDNACAADQVANLVRRFTADAATRLHVSIAGGRKTLGFFAGYALSLWGRDTDRLTHVLVSEPFESSWDFFYPTPDERIIQTRLGMLADCAQAEVTLADLPFVRLRHGLPQALLTGDASFAEAVQTAQARIGPPRLLIDFASQAVTAGGTRLALPPADLAFLAWFARRARQGLPGVACPQDGVPSAEHAAAYLAEYRRVRGVLGDDGRSATRYRSGMSKADFEERKSKLKRLFSDALGSAAAPYLIAGQGRRPMLYRLILPPDAIGFSDQN